jgi:hypothetical protein
MQESLSRNSYLSKGNFVIFYVSAVRRTPAPAAAATTA